MKNTICIVSLFLLLAFNSGCCAIFAGRKQEVSFNSNPPGAKILDEDGVFYGVTPCTVKYPRKYEFVIFQFENNEPVKISTNQRINWFILLNVPIYGWIIDMAACNGVPYFIDDEIVCELE